MGRNRERWSDSTADSECRAESSVERDASVLEDRVTPSHQGQSRACDDVGWWDSLSERLRPRYGSNDEGVSGVGISPRLVAGGNSLTLQANDGFSQGPREDACETVGTAVQNVEAPPAVMHGARHGVREVVGVASGEC